MPDEGYPDSAILFARRVEHRRKLAWHPAEILLECRKLQPNLPHTLVARISLCVFAGFALTALAVGTWANYWAPRRGDQYQLTRLGHVLSEGGLLYRDVWEN